MQLQSLWLFVCSTLLVDALAIFRDATSLLQLLQDHRSNTSNLASLAPSVSLRAAARTGVGTAYSASLSGVLSAEQDSSALQQRSIHAQDERGPAKLPLQPPLHSGRSVTPSIWACIGPVASPEMGTDPLTAFTDVKQLLQSGKQALKPQMVAQTTEYMSLYERGDRNHTHIMEELRRQNLTQPSKSQQNSLPQFPTEYGPAGKTVWAMAQADLSASTVHVDFAEAARYAEISDPGMDRLPQSGWAVADIDLDNDSVLLIRCNEAFKVDDDEVLKTPDVYEEYRAVSVYHLDKGRHQIFVRFRTVPFWCDVLEDSVESRENATHVVNQSDVSCPLAVLSDCMMSDVVEGHVASPYIAVPLINMAVSPVRVTGANVSNGPRGLSAGLLAGKEDVLIASGQSYIVNLILIQGPGLLPCNTSMRLGLTLHVEAPDGQQLPSLSFSISADCIAYRHGGFKVTFPDYDGSIQHMWVAPPNVDQLQDGSCPESGCPVLLSLHGAGVIVSSNWGHNYALTQESGSPFPYPSWLIEPSNRYHWGTDWEGPGYDDALAALDYVRLHLPGVTAVDKRRMRLDPDRLVLTGHSMGGHGCLVFSVHDPDRLLASLCGACWTSQARYVRVGGSALLDEPSNAVLKTRMAEHAADLLARNLRGVPLKLVYGNMDDNVPPREPRYMSRLVDSYSASVSAVNVSELPGVGHWFVQSIPEVRDFLQAHLAPSASRNSEWDLPALPQEFEFMVPTVSSFGSKGNLKVLQLADAARPGRLYVRRCHYAGAELNGTCGAGGANSQDGDEDEVWYIRSSNIRRLGFANPPVRGRPLPQLIVLDGSNFAASAISGSPEAHLCRADLSSDWKVCVDARWELLQRAGPRTSEGPVHNVLRRAPLCLAHGSGAGEAELALALANKLYFVSRYAVPVVAAGLGLNANVSANSNSSSSSGSSRNSLPAHCLDANLVLVGSPQTNSLLEQHRCAFPYVRFHDPPSRGFSLGGLAYEGPGLGLLALGRLPSGRLAAAVMGSTPEGLVHAGERLPITAFGDGADYLVLGKESSWQGAGGVLASGYLDPLWRVSSSGWAEPEHSVDAEGWAAAGTGTGTLTLPPTGIRARAGTGTGTGTGAGTGTRASLRPAEDPRCEATRLELRASEMEILGVGGALGRRVWLGAILAWLVGCSS